MLKIRFILTSLLALQLTGIAAFSFQAQASSLSADDLMRTGENLDREISAQLQAVQRAQVFHRALPSNASIELPRLEAGLKLWAKDIAAAFATPDERSPFTRELKLGMLNRYLNFVTSMATLRISLGLSHDTQWLESMTLVLPNQAASILPAAMGTASNPRAGANFFPMKITQRANHLEVRITQALMAGLELANLASENHDANYLTLVQYLATHQLLQNLESIRLLKTSGQVKRPTLPTALIRKLPMLGLQASIDQEQKQIEAEPSLREELTFSVAKISNRLPKLASKSLTKRLAVVADVEATSSDVAGLLAQSLFERETAGFSEAITQELQNGSQALSTLSNSELVNQLKQSIANARANSLLEVFLQLQDEATLILNDAQRKQVLDEIEAARATYARSLDVTLLNEWITTAKSQAGQIRAKTHREDFLLALVNASLDLTARKNSSATQLEVEPRLLARMAAPALAKRNMRESVQQALGEIANEESFSSARETYLRIATERFGAEPTEAAAEIETAPSPDINPALLAKMKDAVSKGRIKDRADFQVLGQLMGFTRSALNEKRAMISDVFPRPKDQKKYLKTLETSLSLEYPILNQEISVPVEHPIARRQLSDILADIARHNHGFSSIYVLSWPIIEATLAHMENQIHANLRRVGEAKQPSDIEAVITGSMMLELVMQGFPEFRIQQERMTENLMSPSLTTQLVRKYAAWYLMSGFAVDGLLKLSRWGSKRAFSGIYAGTRYLNFIMRPLIKGYMRSAALAAMVDMTAEYTQLRRQQTSREQTEAFFLGAGADGGAPLIDFLEFQNANSAYRMSQGVFLASAVFNLSFFRSEVTQPLLSRALKSQGFVKAAEIGRDARAFQTLGLMPGEWNEVQTAYNRALKNRWASNAARFAKQEDAFQRLQMRQRQGQAWASEEVIKPGMNSTTFSKLKAALLKIQGEL